MDPHSGRFKTTDEAMAEMGLKAPGATGTPKAAKKLVQKKTAQKKGASLANPDMVTAREVVEARVEIPADLWPKFEQGAELEFRGVVFSVVDCAGDKLMLKIKGVTRNYLRKAAQTMKGRAKAQG